MRKLKQETERFLAMQAVATIEARQRAALQLACGIDMAAADGAAIGEVEQILKRLDRAIERERQKGLRRHWSYDLNRHIALKQARDRLRTRLGGASAVAGPKFTGVKPAPRRRRK